MRLVLEHADFAVELQSDLQAEWNGNCCIIALFETIRLVFGRTRLTWSEPLAQFPHAELHQTNQCTQSFQAIGACTTDNHMQQCERRSHKLNAPPSGEFWIFGYGSLMWRPGFQYVHKEMARLYGYRRSLCVWCREHRGTPDNPGLVFGLDAGGSCSGIAYRVADHDKHAVLEYLYERELVNPVYVPRWLCIRLQRCRTVRALTFTTDRSREQYAGSLGVEQIAVVVRRAQGRSGHNVDYVTNTVARLAEIGIRDRQLMRILEFIG